jgi:hypothetical protein
MHNFTKECAALFSLFKQFQSTFATLHSEIILLSRNFRQILQVLLTDSFAKHIYAHTTLVSRNNRKGSRKIADSKDREH